MARAGDGGCQAWRLLRKRHLGHGPAWPWREEGELPGGSHGVQRGTTPKPLVVAFFHGGPDPACPPLPFPPPPKPPSCPPPPASAVTSGCSLWGAAARRPRRARSCHCGGVSPLPPHSPPFPPPQTCAGTAPARTFHTRDAPTPRGGTHRGEAGPTPQPSTPTPPQAGPTGGHQAQTHPPPPRHGGKRGRKWGKMGRKWGKRARKWKKWKK